MGQAGRGAAQRSSPLLRDEPSPSASTLGAASPTASSPHGRDMFSYRLREWRPRLWGGRRCAAAAAVAAASLAATLPPA